MQNEELLRHIQNYIKSGEYFVDSKSWYHTKYTNPLVQRTLVLICSVVFCILFIGIAINTYSLFPLVEQVRYALHTQNAFQTTATITRADYVEEDPLASVADILVRDYVKQRESYNYYLLKKQFTFVQNMSTRMIYKKFYNQMNIDNIDSMILKYKTDIKRNVTEILSSEYTGDNEITVRFHAVAKNVAGDIVEDKTFTVIVTFDIAEIDLDIESGSKFDFIVTDYILKAN